jgi:hypothetical protein
VTRKLLNGLCGSAVGAAGEVGGQPRRVLDLECRCAATAQRRRAAAMRNGTLTWRAPMRLATSSNVTASGPVSCHALSGIGASRSAATAESAHVAHVDHGDLRVHHGRNQPPALGHHRQEVLHHERRSEEQKPMPLSSMRRSLRR